MTDERWDEVVRGIKERFELADEGEEDEGNHGVREFYVFKTPMGQIKLERVVKPKLLEKNTLYSNRKGSTASVNYVFSEDEFVNVVTAYKWNDSEDSWDEIDPEAFV